MSSDDYYEILGLTKPSNRNEIKKAYHKLALKYHPDKNTVPDATKTFREINEAYDVLSTPEKKEIYDKYGKNGLQQNNIHFDESNIFNIFNAFFGQSFPFGMPERVPQGMNPLVIIEQITLTDVFTGKKINKTIERESQCQKCQGLGSDDGKARTCKTCHGQKIVREQIRMGPMWTIKTGPCAQCHGSGIDLSEHVCGTCHGNKTVKEKFTINFTIAPGQIGNNVIVIKNAGHIMLDNKTRGDIVIKIIAMENKEFLRNVTINNKLRLSEYDLLIRVTINTADSLCGFSKIIKHVSGEDIVLNSSDIIKDGDIYVIDGKGLPMKHNQRGKLYVLFNVETIKTLTACKKKIIWETLMETPYTEHNFDPQKIIRKLNI